MQPRLGRARCHDVRDVCRRGLSAMIVDELIQTTARASSCLTPALCKDTVRFIHSQWNRDGGVQGKCGQSDLAYTVFAVICMQALRGRMPLLRLWKYLQAFGDGTSLDILHLFCLIRLRSMYPMSAGMRARLLKQLDERQAESPSDIFFKVVMAEFLKINDRPDVKLEISNDDTTPDLAAAVVINHAPDEDAEAFLMQRYLSGGFGEMPDAREPDLYSTVTALFALHVMNVDLSPLRRDGLSFIETMRCRNGGYACRKSDFVADSECTFYALLSMGCLAE